METIEDLILTGVDDYDSENEYHNKLIDLSVMWLRMFSSEFVDSSDSGE